MTPHLVSPFLPRLKWKRIVGVLAVLAALGAIGAVIVSDVAFARQSSDPSGYRSMGSYEGY
jgi:hypothetical protein